MRIEKLVLHNYRQFKEEEVWFHKDPDSDLHILIGENGTGKTNVLNAINWCLYGDEPHLSRESQQLPIVNLETIEETRDGRQQEVSVGLCAETGVNAYIVFKRAASYRAHSDREPTHEGTTFEVRATDEQGNTEIVSGEDGESYVDRFVPKRIREFFFFDGERLDRYFREATAQNIRHAVFRISQLDLLENEVERKLDLVVRSLEKEAGKLNPHIESVREKLEAEKRKRDDIVKQIEKKEEQAAVAKGRISEYEEKLSGIPDIEGLENERKRLQGEKTIKEKQREEKVRAKHRFLFERGTTVMLCPAISETIRIIEEKESSGEIPPTVDRGLLEKALQEDVCEICGRDLDEGSREQVRELLEKISLSSEIARQLVRMETSLRQLVEHVEQLENDAWQATREVKAFEEDIKRYDRRLAEIDRELAGYEEEKIKEWHRERKNYEEIHEQIQRDLGYLYPEAERMEETVDELQEEFDAETRKERKAGEIIRQRDFCNAAREVVTKTQQDIMQEIRQRIGTQTEELFFDLTWKAESFKAVNVEPDYNISLIHSSGYECLGSVSAGERELLALSFTLALHDVSGFDSPILIDTPVARISGKHRENFGGVLGEVSKEKQTILLFTPAEYSEEIREALESGASSRYLLGLSSDEKVSKVEVL